MVKKNGVAINAFAIHGLPQPIHTKDIATPYGRTTIRLLYAVLSGS